jgi:hypothetical protein
MFAPKHLRSKHHYAVTSLPLATSLVRKGKHSKKTIDKSRRFFMSMSYEKDIFAVFAYEFELLHNRSFSV